MSRAMRVDSSSRATRSCSSCERWVWASSSSACSARWTDWRLLEAARHGRGEAERIGEQPQAGVAVDEVAHSQDRRAQHGHRPCSAQLRADAGGDDGHEHERAGGTARRCAAEQATRARHHPQLRRDVPLAEGSGRPAQPRDDGGGEEHADDQAATVSARVVLGIDDRPADEDAAPTRRTNVASAAVQSGQEHGEHGTGTGSGNSSRPRHAEAGSASRGSRSPSAGGWWLPAITPARESRRPGAGGGAAPWSATGRGPRGRPWRAGRRSRRPRW